MLTNGLLNFHLQKYTRNVNFNVNQVSMTMQANGHCKKINFPLVEHSATFYIDHFIAEMLGNTKL